MTNYMCRQRTRSNGARAVNKKGNEFLTKVNLFICANSYLLLTQYRHVVFSGPTRRVRELCYIMKWGSHASHISHRHRRVFEHFCHSLNHFPFGSWMRDSTTAVAVAAIATDRVLIFQLNSNTKSSCKCAETCRATQSERGGKMRTRAN